MTAPTRAELVECLRQLYYSALQLDMHNNSSEAVSSSVKNAFDLLQEYDAHPEQPGIGDRRALSPGKTDTSAAAARTVEHRLGPLRHRVLHALCIATEGNAHAVATAAGVPYHNAQPRLRELVQLGFVHDSGRRVKNARGNSTIVWQPTQKGHDYVQRHPV